MASICCSPPDMVPGELVAALGEAREHGEDLRERFFAPPRARGTRAPISRFSSTVSEGNTWRPSATCPIPRLQMSCDSSPSIRASLKRTVPERAFSIPATVRMREDFPAPFAPTIATISPCGTCSETWSSACASP